MIKLTKHILAIGMVCLVPLLGVSQPVPAPDENIPFLITFGKAAESSWGDDDHSQTFFFMVPETHTAPVYIRVFDPDVGGQNDELNGDYDTRVTYSVYLGDGCHSSPDAQGTDPIGNYKSGTLYNTKTFGQVPRYDNQWYTFGPINPTEGEYMEYFKGYVFKVICEGLSGNDGNLYRYFLSTEPNTNKEVEGGNAFSYEYTFRMHDDPNEISHIYPFVDEETISVQQSNFDWDNDGIIRIVSVVKTGQMTKVSGEDEWMKHEFKILEEEKNTSLDFQFIKKRPAIKNNNVVVNVKNQRGENIKFFSIPIGGVPVPKQGPIGVRSGK